MKKESYLLSEVQYTLERQFTNRDLLRNPRISEINDITIRLAEKTGTVSLYEPGSYIHEQKLRQMIMWYLDNPTYIEIDKFGEVKVNIPEYIDFENEINKKEYYLFQIAGEGKIARTRFKFEKKGNTEIKSINEKSFYDKNGIEIRREVRKLDNDVETKRRYTRMDGKPNVIQEENLTTGEIRFFDIKDSEHFENLDISLGKEVKKEETKMLTPVERIRLAERTRYSVYGDGIKEMLGMYINVDERKSDTQR